MNQVKIYVVLTGLQMFLYFLPRPPLRYDLGYNITAFQALATAYAAEAGTAAIL